MTNHSLTEASAWTEAYDVWIAHRTNDPTEVKAWVDPTDEDRYEISQGWIIRHKLLGVLAADEAELLQVVADELFQPRMGAFALERGVRSVGALAERLPPALDLEWTPLGSDEVGSPADRDSLARLVEAVYEVFGHATGDIQARIFGFNVSRQRRR